MAIRFYRELTGSEFLDRVQSWHDVNDGCTWYQRLDKDMVFFGAPSPRDIAEAAYGVYREEKGQRTLHIDEKLRRATVERLLPCIVDGTPIPRDLVESCVRRASNRNGFELWEWENALGIACALYRYRNKERRYSMTLERDRKTRDYLYGRLLALAERME
jgi:CRISPR-associated protein Csd1